ncbi:MAG: VCBS repeat-containing protein [Deltaproteobacteria bacterium]|nr:VCBS repeat-containing protein [Deltaproteobacteria bacterium]
MRRRLVPSVVALLALLAAGCGGTTPEGGRDGGLDADLPDAEPDLTPPPCGTGGRPLQGGLAELSWDDGVGAANLREKTWSITVDGTTYQLNAEVLWEAVRFEVDHPARIHGFSVQWAGIPDGVDPATELRAGLYPDFGYNGFDFWQWEPLWEGTRCARDIQPGEWVTYTFDQPLELAHPGLVYVAHQIQPQDPVFAFDLTETGDGDCAIWANCHSAMNLPNAGGGVYYNGISFSFQYDYLVRLHVEYTEQLAPTDRIFQPRDLPAHSRAAFGDFDNDGWDDLVTDGPALYRNNGDGTFTDVTAASGVAAMGLSAGGGVWGDYDNDGCLDLFLFSESLTQADALLQGHCDGTFTDVTAGSGITDYQTYNPCGDPVNNVRSPTAAAAWVDLDADGFLDLYLANFICWGATPETY